jgi:folate-binding protein YgfZ
VAADLGGDGPGETIAAEYAAARSDAALVELPERGVLAVTGPHRQRFLHGILSNDVQGRQPGQGCLAALMDVKGHLLALMRVLVRQDEVLLEMAADRLQEVERLLLHYKVGAPVRFAVRATTVLGLIGPRGREALGALGLETPDLAAEGHVGGAIAGHDVLLARASDLPASSLVIHVEPSAGHVVSGALASAGVGRLGRKALDALRIEDGRAWYGTDVGPENLLHETGLLSEYHSFAKGCYVGQEVVARLEGRGGHVNKLLRGLRLAAPSLAGEPMVAGDKEVGRVTTSAVSPRLGPIAMGFVHRSHAAPGTTVEAGGATATVVALPMERG